MHILKMTEPEKYPAVKKRRKEEEKEERGRKVMRTKNLKKFVAVAMSVMCLAGAVTGCGNKDTGSSADGGSASQEISVVSREEGSGTRGAFIELFGIEEKDASGNKVDNTTDDAITTNSTSVMMTTVAGNKAAIGYASLGSLNDTVKALKVDGAEATAENVKSGKYKISRPFNIATKGDVSEVAQDFINYIMSAEGQKIVEANGCISEGNNGSFTSTMAAGKIVVGGSSSVSPVMEKLIESYKKINSSAEIELQESDSTSGMTGAIDGKFDIGMASRELKDSEKSSGLTSQVIALDGVAVIVNTDNSLTDITSEQVKAIFTGNTTDWADVK